MIVPMVRECEWAPRLESLPAWRPPPRKTLVVAPHPDDEVLGAGGLIAALRSRGTDVAVAAVTDGENAYRDTPHHTPHLGKVREREQAKALSRLGVGPEQILRLRLPDSGLIDCEDRLVDILLQLVSEDMHIVAPWRSDFHPDHEVCGRAAEAVARQKKLPLTSYFFWTWHRGSRETLDQLELVKFRLNQEELRAKQEGLLCHKSQLEPTSGSPILPLDLLEPVNRPFEVFLPA